MTGTTASRFAGPAVLLLLLAAAALQLGPGGVYYAEWMQDIFLTLDGVERMRRGQWPHTGFPTPIGVLYFLPFYLASLLVGVTQHLVVLGPALFALLLAAATLWIARRRLPPAAGALLALYAGLLALSPRQLGQAFTVVSNNAAYNRFGWALVAVLAALAFLPRQDEADGQGAFRDGVLAGLLGTAAALDKVTFAAAGAILVVMALATLRRTGILRFLGGAAIAPLLVLGGLEATTGLVGAYLNDLRTAAAAQASLARTAQALAIAGDSAVGLGLAVALTVLVRSRPDWRLLLALVAIVGAGAALGVQNHMALENPLVPVAALIGWSAASRNGTALPRPGWPRLGILLLAVLLLRPTVTDAMAIAWTAAAPKAPAAALASLADTPLAGLRLPDQPNRLPPGADAEHALNDVEYVALLAEGTALLRPFLAADQVVMSLTWTNPFPTLLRRPPVPHALLWWDPGRSFSAAVRPDGDTMFRGVDLVMIPNLYHDMRSTELMREVYRPVLDQLFEPAAASPHWQLLRRKPTS